MIGLFLGEKKLPLEILKSLKKKKVKYFIIDLSKNNKFKKDKNSYFINIGKFGKILELIKILGENKIKVIKLNTYNPELTLRRGCYTKLKPSMTDKLIMKKGIEILNRSNSFNHVQALVINNKKIISYEKRKGTGDMLKSIRNNNLKNKLLIKMPKSKQDLRVDLPTFGLDTLKDCKKANIKGIVVKAGQNIFLDKRKGLQFANKNNIFVMAK